MKRFTISTGIAGLHEHIDLLRSLVRRDVESRYRGTLLGFMWAIAYPLLMLLVYSFVFGGVFNARWGVQREGGGFVVMLYCGLIVYGVFADTLTRSPTAVLANPSYVKKVVFPLELLPVVHLFSALFSGVVGLLLLALFVFIGARELPMSSLLVPLVFAPLLLLTLGIGWFLAALGVFFRDVGQVITVVMSLMMFLSPVFYPISSAPLVAQFLMYLNPITFPIEALRQVMVLGTIPSWEYWVIYTLVSVAVALGGLWFFQRSRPAFADVI